MKSRPALAVAASLLLIAVHASAQAQSRASSEARIRAVFAQASAFTPESPTLELLLGPARAANPTLKPEAWSALRADFAAAANSALNAEGGIQGGVLPFGMAALSDAELARLAGLLEDPAYRKFQSASNSPPAQRAALQAGARTSMLLMTAINRVLKANGLVEVNP